MTKWISYSLILLSLHSCNKTGEVTDGTTPVECSSEAQAADSTAVPCPAEPEGPVTPIEGEPPAEEPVEEDPTNLPDAALTFDTDIYLVNFDAAQTAKLESAVVLIKKVIATEEFRDRILNYTYNGKKTFVDNEGFSNEEIYQKILDAAETMNGNKNNIMDVELELYYSFTSTVGYTYPDTTRIWMNTKFFNSYTPVQVADNLTHEWLHKLGFGHAQNYSPARDHSVPYAIGYIMEELASKVK